MYARGIVQQAGRNRPKRGFPFGVIRLAFAAAMLVLLGCAKPEVGFTKPAESTESKAEALEENAAAGGRRSEPSLSARINESAAQAIDPIGEAPMDDAITCLARTIYWEARSEEPAVMDAIANVVMNRLEHKRFPNTVCEVVMQGREAGSCQFSWWCDGRSDDASEYESYAIAKEVSRRSLNLQIADSTGGALYFHERKAKPSWSIEYIKTVEVGSFIFYKPYGSDAR